MMTARKGISRRDFMLASTGAALGALAAACAPQVAEETMEVKPTEEVEEEPTVAPPEEAVEIRHSHWWGERYADWWNPIFTEKYGITVKDEPAPWAEYHTKLLTQLAAGAAPDAFLQVSYYNGDFFKSGQLLRLNDIVAEEGLDMDAWGIDPFLENAYKGDLFGLSHYSMQALIFFVNKEIAAEAGVTVPEWGTPEFDTWKWDDLVEFCKATTKVKADGTVEQYGEGDNFAYAYSGQKYGIVQHGGQIFDDEWSYDETECVINSPVAVEALEMQTDMVLVHNVAPTLEASEAIPEGLYRSGMAAGVFSWCDPGTFKPDDMKFEQTYIHFPFTKQRTQHVGADHHSVYKGSEKLDAAITYAVAMTTDEDIETVTAELMGVPAYRPKYFLDKMPETDLWTKNMYRVQLSRDERFSEHAPSTENVEWSSKWWGGQVPLWFRDQLSTKLQQVLVGEATMQEAMDELKAATDAEIAKKL